MLPKIGKVLQRLINNWSKFYTSVRSSVFADCHAWPLHKGSPLFFLLLICASQSMDQLAEMSTQLVRTTYSSCFEPER